jgi:hypothetical protein
LDAGGSGELEQIEPLFPLGYLIRRFDVRYEHGLTVGSLVYFQQVSSEDAMLQFLEAHIFS